MSSAPVGTKQDDRRRTAHAGDRARRPGSRAVPLAVAVILAAVVGVAIWSAAASGGAGSSPASARYGGLPSWLPRAKVKVDRVLSGSPGRPAISVQGEAVRVLVGGASVMATGVGPEVPEEGRFPVPEVTPATFLITFSSASAAIPLSQGQFGMVDERGALHHPHVTARGSGPMPTEIVPGRPVTVELHAILPTGNGALTWAPRGTRPSASWDYTVEVD
jgi:hypothetical protein